MSKEQKDKGVIMSKNGLSEQQAYDYIRNISREKNISMKTRCMMKTCGWSVPEPAFILNNG